MGYAEHLAERVSDVLKERQVRFIAKKMMGGLCFMVDGKMCLGINEDTLLCRVGKDNYEMCLKKKGCREMDFTGRPLRGFVYVAPEAIDLDTDLEYWVDLCLAFNPQAKRSRK